MTSTEAHGEGFTKNKNKMWEREEKGRHSI